MYKTNLVTILVLVGIFALVAGVATGYLWGHQSSTLSERQDTDYPPGLLEHRTSSVVQSPNKDPEVASSVNTGRTSADETES